MTWLPLELTRLPESPSLRNTGQFISGAGAQSSGGVILAPSTNAEWAQQAEAYLSNIGYDAQTVAAALGKYLTGQTLTSDQSAIVAAAKGFFGNPPTTPPLPPTTTPPPGQGGGDNDHGHKRHKKDHDHPKGDGGDNGNSGLWPVDITPPFSDRITNPVTMALQKIGTFNVGNIIPGPTFNPPFGPPRQIGGGTVGGKKIV